MGGIGRQKKWLEQLCQQWYEPVLRYAHTQLRDVEAAREVTQETFLIACVKQALLAQHPNPGGFLFTTARNLAKNRRKQAFLQMAREPLTADGQLPEREDPEAGLERILDQAVDEQDWIEEVLSRLEPEKYRLYALHYLEGVPMKEIAQRFGLRPEAVRMRYLRLRREIREIAAAVAEENFPV